MFLFPLYFFTFWITAQYKWHRHGFLPPPETSQVEVEFPCALDPLKGCPQRYCLVVGLMGSYIWVRWTVVSLFPSIYDLVWVWQPGGTAFKEGNNVTERRHVTSPRPGNTLFIYCWLTTSLRSLAIILLKQPYTTLHYWHPRLQQILLLYLPRRPYTGLCLYIRNGWDIEWHRSSMKIQGDGRVIIFMVRKRCDIKLCRWLLLYVLDRMCVRCWDRFQTVHQSMENHWMVANELYIQVVIFAFKNFVAIYFVKAYAQVWACKKVYQ